ncbi:bacteriohemerythrin [Dechloromonas sp. XY25]|uniref:Bacteriohemerythrin n=1 Tax=Dechloromonas hankyongensis TaxID=2908002 RepID=A0ABS9K0N6_9RHOO|nr:bacteriohemerythrin [Dechloromonas hankyongensis]MCG2576706.1 bacteriohemerythrin [Dechloromonas hankyongensis]
MNKDQEILAVSRLVFELTTMGQAETDLDGLLAKLHGLLVTLPGIHVLPHSAILLYNPRRHLIQIAQFGLPAAWENPVQRGNSRPEAELHADIAYVATPATHHPALSVSGIDDQAPCFVLPLADDGRQLGEALLFIAPEWRPDAIEVEFMTDLSRALSMLVSRRLMNETLRVREVELEDARTDAIRRLGAASEYRDNETGMHVMRMTHFATAIAKAMDLPLEMREMLAICAPMHDVGKIGIADAILLKPGRLTPDEYEVMKTHTEIGERLLGGNDALIAAARDIAAYHHERWDGTGYPYGLRGEAIPVLARICALADVFDALTSIRPYKRPWPMEDAIAYLHKESGTYFDPAVVAAFDRALPEISRIRELYRDDIIDPNQAVSLPASAYRADGWVAWDASLSIGIDAIDEHHRYLFDLTNDLFDVVQEKRGAREVARVLKALDQYTQVHFRAEERMMDHYGYTEQTRQHDQHRSFEEKLEEFYAELHDNPLTAPFDTLLYLRGWLIHHIKVEDAKLAVLRDAA